MAPLSLVLIAPAEEYLFRGVIQRRLIRNMQARSAIVVTSFLFAIPHAIGYLGRVEGIGIILWSIGPFSVGIIMGILYEKSNNLTVPILAHGFYNVVVFIITYLTGFQLLLR